MPISRSIIQRLGNQFGYARVTDFPVNISVSVSAILSDLKEGNVTELLFNEEEHDLTFTMREPRQSGDGTKALQFTVKGARLEGESFSSSIGDNKSDNLKKSESELLDSIDQDRMRLKNMRSES